MTSVILKVLILIAILWGLYFFYERKAKSSHGKRVNRQPSRNLQTKLLRLLNGDRHTANRLIALAKTRNPDKSVDWWVEKVIFGLERDRT
ncbi:MAG: hypothetical protein KME01_03510 [Chroococcus sp. CMT-3BRIN-NPC107]|jgi:hypothetical protein|nr:hypothetical protein [Chroococcus sp. CMT-3BRIN-NPC107]